MGARDSSELFSLAMQFVASLAWAVAALLEGLSSHIGAAAGALHKVPSNGSAAPRRRRGGACRATGTPSSRRRHRSRKLKTRIGFSNTDALYFIAAVAWLLSCFATAHAMGLLTQSSKEAPSLPGTDEAKDSNV